VIVGHILRVEFVYPLENVGELLEDVEPLVLSLIYRV